MIFDQKISISFEKHEFQCQNWVKPTHNLSIRRQCELLGTPRSQVYFKPVEPSTEAKNWEEYLMARLDFWHTEMPYIGTRKMVKMLQTEGILIGRKLVRRLMSDMGIAALYPKVNLSKRNFKESIVPYLLRNTVISKQNKAWSIDITYIKTGKSHQYLTAIIDWHSLYIVGWNLSETLDTSSVIQAVNEAVKTHGKPEILNSDQGCQFTSNEYKNMLKDLEITQSMDGKARWADNIMIERWFRSLKVENIYTNEYLTPRSLRQGISAYIEQYNAVRPHEALGYKTPCSIYFADLDSQPATQAAGWWTWGSGVAPVAKQVILWSKTHDNFFGSGLDKGTIILKGTSKYPCQMSFLKFGSQICSNLS